MDIQNDTFANIQSSKIRKENMTDTQNLYPHSQMSVFLRTCEEEILEPIYGKVSGICSFAYLLYKIKLNQCK